MIIAHDEGFKLQHTTLHEKFKNLLDDKFKAFLKTEHITDEEFSKAASRFMTNHENGKPAIFIKLLMAVTEFDVFIELLRVARHELDKKLEDSSYKRRGDKSDAKKIVNSRDSPSRRKRNRSPTVARRNRNRSPSKGHVAKSLTLNSTI